MLETINRSSIEPKKKKGKNAGDISTLVWVQSHSGGLAERFIYGRFANVAAGSFQFDTSIHVRAPSVCL